MINTKISIAMATYNGARFLKEQLDSIAAQIRLPDELIICDDGSTDETPDLINKFINNSPFPIKLILNKINWGYAKNFEKAIQLCEGDIVALADQDDIWYPNKLMRIQEIFENQDKIGLVFSNSQLINEVGIEVGRTLWERGGFNKKRETAFRSNPFLEIIKGPLITGMTTAFRTKYIPKIIPIGKSWHHDAWIALLMSLLTKVEPIPEILQAYRVHNSQQTYVPLKGKLPRASIQERAKRFQEASIRYEIIARHIYSWNDNILIQYAVPILKNKAKNKRVRAMAYSKNIYWHVILKELFSGGYHKYASGWRGALGDILRIAKPTNKDY